MITKVKGEAIKEGSIPYSALATEVKEKIDKLVNITYANLKSLRDNSQLIPGQQYRIVDYITTTSQADTSTAGHQFDVIVTADSKNTLNENARACKPEFSIERYKDAIYLDESEICPVEYLGEFVYNNKKYYRYYIDAYSAEILIDWEGSSSLQYTNVDGYPEYKYDKKSDFIRRHENGVWGAWNNRDWENIIVKNDIIDINYFAYSDLNTWELKYCLDNDYTRFEWAQISELSPETKRKIIRVYDGRNDDDISYIFLRWPEGDENGEYAWLYDWGGDDLNIKEYVSEGSEDYDSDEYIYTTTENPSIGYSVDGYGSVIEVSSTATGKGVIYYMKDEFNNECPYDFKNIMFRVTSGQSEYNYYTFYGLYTNKKDDSMNGNSYGNVIKPYTKSGRININMIRFGSYCYNNTFGYNCSNNTFGGSCSNNTFGYNCYKNTFGDSCSNNTFGDSCSSNSFVRNCSDNSFGSACFRNSFGSACSDNSFGNNCYDISFGNDCSDNSFGNNCSYITFGTSLTTKNYYRDIIIDNKTKYIYLNCTSTTSTNNYFQNIKIGLGVQGTYSSRITISNSGTNQNYETLYRAANSKTLKPDGTSF